MSDLPSKEQCQEEFWAVIAEWLGELDAKGGQAAQAEAS